MKQKPQQPIESIAKRFGIVLLYHSVSPNTPGKPENTIHNTTPDCFEKNLRDIGKHFKFVNLEELSSSADKSGLASVTFDDGYKNIFLNALPILEKYRIPGTLFLNPVTFNGQYNWRDKVRHVIKNNLEDTFLKTSALNFREGKFYRYSKSCLNNSHKIDTQLNNLIGNKTLNVYKGYPYLTIHELILDNPLINYGNHSLDHYVLSSLDESQQTHQIIEAQNRLKEAIGSNISKCFSAPFGGTSDINNATLSILRKADYKSVLMSRQKLQPGRPESERPQVLERFMPRSKNIIDEIFSALNTT